MASKIFIILSILYVTVDANDVRLGYAAPNSRRIFSEIKQADPALWTRTDDVIVNTPGNDVITAVTVTDLRDDKAGDAYIESGGLGMKSVTIGLRSPSILRGYKFQIEVYAEDPNGRLYTKGAVGGVSGYNSGYYDSNARIFTKGGAAPYYNDDGQYARKY